MFGLAGDSAGMTADTHVLIYDKAVFHKVSAVMQVRP
jgi:hypothetical protein